MELKTKMQFKNPSTGHWILRDKDGFRTILKRKARNVAVMQKFLSASNPCIPTEMSIQIEKKMIEYLNGKIK